MIGPGIYDNLCTYVREEARARGTIVIVLDGSLGSGFSCQADLLTTIKLPEILRSIADQIEKNVAGRGLAV